MMRTDNLSESTASGKYASQRLHTTGPGGFYPAAAGCSLQRSTGPLPSRSRGRPPGRWCLLVETLQATDQARGRPFGSCRPERLICSRRRRYIPAMVLCLLLRLSDKSLCFVFIMKTMPVMSGVSRDENLTSFILKCIFVRYNRNEPQGLM